MYQGTQFHTTCTSWRLFGDLQGTRCRQGANGALVKSALLQLLIQAMLEESFQNPPDMLDDVLLRILGKDDDII